MFNDDAFRCCLVNSSEARTKVMKHVWSNVYWLEPLNHRICSNSIFNITGFRISYFIFQDSSTHLKKHLNKTFLTVKLGQTDFWESKPTESADCLTGWFWSTHGGTDNHLQVLYALTTFLSSTTLESQGGGTWSHGTACEQQQGSHDLLLMENASFAVFY